MAASSPSPSPLSSVQELGSALLRSLNVLIKSVRLYGATHQRTQEQLKRAVELAKSATADGEPLLFGLAANRSVLVNGKSLPDGPAEASFAQALHAGNISSIEVLPGATSDDLLAFTVALAGKDPRDILRFNTETGSHLRVNEVHYVARRAGEAAAAPASPSSATGPAPTPVNSSATLAVLASELIASDPSLSAAPAATAASAAAPAGDMEQLAGMWLRHFAQRLETSSAPEQDVDLAALLEKLDSAGVKRQIEGKELVELAERCALQLALERYNRGEVKNVAVPELLHKLSREVAHLRKQVGAAEPESRSGPDALQREFWASVPAQGKLGVLLSDDAWCIPAQNVESFARELAAAGDHATAAQVVLRYVACTSSAEKDARLKAAEGLAVLINVLSELGAQAMDAAVIQVARALSVEADSLVETALTVGLSRLTLQSLKDRHFAAVHHAIAALNHLEKHRATTARELRARLRIEDRLPELVRETAAGSADPGDVAALLKRLPVPATRAIVEQFTRSSRRDTCDRLLDLAERLGEPLLEQAVTTFRTGTANDAARVTGILSRLAPEMMQEELAQRCRNWPLLQQEIAVRQIAAAATRHTGKLLLAMLSEVQPALRPTIIDEIGCCGEELAIPALLEIAGSHDAREFGRVKAIEALGRMREARAISLLRDIILARKAFGWRNAEELRVTAMHALRLIDPLAANDSELEAAFKTDPVAGWALTESEGQGWARKRRYHRISIDKPLNATVTTQRGSAGVTVQKLSLGGGLALRHSHAQLAGEGTLEFTAGFRKLKARILVQEVGDRRIAFEILDMALEDRLRLRKLLAGEAAASGQRVASRPAAKAASTKEPPKEKQTALPSFPDDHGYTL